VLWIDTICISQNDLEERNQQVRFMNMIYHNARRVLVWLGKEADESDIAIDYLRHQGEERRCADCEPEYWEVL